MTVKKLISILLCLFILLPPTQGWSQKYEDQAQFYLQQIGPGQSSGQGSSPTSQRQALPQTTQTRPELPIQSLTPPAPAQILTTAPRQPEEISHVERRAWAQRMFLKQFGYSFFYQPPASFLPVQAVPVGPDYIIGPGDSIKAVIWGSIQGEYNLTVNRNGQVDIPKVGVVHVSGLTFRQLREVMDREFARQYTNYQMNVTLDNLRTIQVFVVGQARFPGSYAISSLSTLVTALFASGGPSKSGSLRNIQVRRGGKVITHFDLYDFLLRGDKSKDMRLQSEDVVFIPPIGPVAAIGTPKTVKEVEEALKSLARVQLQTEERVSAPPSAMTVPPEVSWRKQEDIKIARSKVEVQAAEQQRGWLESEIAGREAAFEARFGLSLPEAAQKLAMSKGIDFGGPVKVPGIYELKNEKTLTDLLKLAGGLGDTAFKGRVQVLRVQGRQAMVLFDDNLEKALSQQHDFRLVNGDFVEIFPVPSLVEKKVAIAGAIKNPGEFGYRENMRVSDLVAYAGGLLQQADKSEAEITRVTITPQGPETTRLNIRLFAALSNVPRDNVVIKPNDYLFIRTVPDWDIYKTVAIEGEVKSPGTYAIKKGETLSSLLARTGGFTDRAFLLGAVLLRASTKEIQRQQLKAAIDRLEARSIVASGEKAAGGIDTDEGKRVEVLARQQQMLIASLRKVEPLGRVVINVTDPERLRGTPDDIRLEEGDKLMVPQAPSTVNVVGAVFAPTAIVYAPYRTVKDYLTMAGGSTEIADEKEIYVIKVNGGAVSRKGFSWLGAGWDGTKYVYHPGGLKSLTLDPGDTIVVPERLERIAWLKEIKDIAVILGNIALTAGVVLVGLKR
jgi:protein involved in polysaccharide export with SLBB domain